MGHVFTTLTWIAATGETHLGVYWAQCTFSAGRSRPIATQLRVIVNWQMLHHAKNKDHLARRRAEQKTDHKIRRCLNRYAARQLFRLMTATSDLDNS